jgi:hypothetical protein
MPLTTNEFSEFSNDTIIVGIDPRYGIKLTLKTRHDHLTKPPIRVRPHVSKRRRVCLDNVSKEERPP